MKSPSAPPRTTRMRLIREKCQSDQRGAVNKSKSVDATPTRSCLAEPADLIAQFVRHHYPGQPKHDQYIGEDGQNQATRFITEKSGIEQWLCHQQRENAQSADGEKLVDKAQSEKEADRQRDQEWAAKSGELSHFHGGNEPEAPEQIDRKNHYARAARPRKPRHDRAGSGSGGE